MHVDAIVEDLLDRQDEIMRELFNFLRMPSVSTDPAFCQGMRRAQEFLLDWLNRMGLSEVQLLDGGGHPAVFGAWNGASGKPTVLIYGHYDVMPPDPIEAWVTPPFEPTIRDGRIYARGASDVKGSTVIALATVAAFLSLRGSCPVNIKIFLEGEEESGSPSLRNIVLQHKELLQAEAMISADGGRASAHFPTINVGCRGLGELEFSIHTADKDLHSGRYGGTVRNAIHEMARIIASLHDERGAIAIPVLMAGVPPLSEEERLQIAMLPFNEAEFLREVGAQGFGETGYSVREQLTLRPALDVNGIWGGYVGPGSKTIIPNTAHAKLSLRIPPGQDPHQALEAVKAHLRNVCSPLGVRLSIIDPNTGTPAFSLRKTHPLVVAAKKVLLQTAKLEPVLVRLGATVPITTIFHELLGVQTLMFGFNLPDEDVHAPNEFFYVKSLAEGLTSWPRLLEELGKFDLEQFRQMAIEAAPPQSPHGDTSHG
ncbi:M20/M25/M40 family metallo-hydrolase [Mesorhizobium sp. B4-1-4]|uniref:M20/M25/M40 family metallo-hydrolase n=1 Tax=Mesorhizobium sp. B4-1-4 TaxID=2589888 RepID=UPI00112BF696|nr:M20/M25/M40 family metallo-hydrolase [Mesorhizobium sp. B4-1-4]UCI31979.1 M20/M25/M40 family metallo-hydrolase [Mesorhizobium sp. B4-1-4]